jgi:hypothetical protein
LDGGGAEKVVTFLNNISQTKNSDLGPKYGIFSLFEASKKGGGKKPSKHAYIRDKVKIEYIDKIPSVGGKYNTF